MPLCLDTTNLAAIEAACEVVKQQPIITHLPEPERLANVPLVAAKYNTKLIAPTMRSEGSVSAEERVNIALEELIPRWEEVGMPLENLIIDPLVLTVSGCQQYVPECIEAVRILKVTGADVQGRAQQCIERRAQRDAPAHQPRVLRHVDGCGPGYDDRGPAGRKQNEFIRIVEERDDSTAIGRLLLALHDAVAAQEELSQDQVDFSDPEQVAIWKTVQILLNKVIYADSYLRV